MAASFSSSLVSFGCLVFDTAVQTLIDNGKLANQIARLQAIVVKSGYLVQDRYESTIHIATTDRSKDHLH